MASDQLVHARDVLTAVRSLRRQGRRRVLQQLEQVEPDLAEHVMEELSRFHRLLLHSPLTSRQCQRVYSQCEVLVLVSVLSLRAATVRFWQDQLLDTRLTQLDPSTETDGTSTPRDDTAADGDDRQPPDAEDESP